MVAVELRTKLTDAAAAAKGKLQGLRGGNKASIAEVPAPEGTLAADDGKVVPTKPSESLATQVWSAVKRARLVIFIVVAVSQALLALISWRIRVSRGRRSGPAGEQEALEALGETLGGIAGALDED